MPHAPRPTIGHVLHRLYLAGAEVLAAALGRRLQDRYRFVYLCLDEIGPLGRRLSEEGFAVEDLRRRPGVDWAVAGRLRRCIEHHGIDLLHAHQYTPFFYAAAARRLRATPPVLFTEHGRHYPDHRRTKRVIANRFLLRRADRVTAVGRFVKQALINHEGIGDHRIEVVHNGIDPQVFEQACTPAARAAVRGEWGVADDQPVVLQVARFHPVKDHTTAIRALAAVVREVPSAVLVMAGDGDLLQDMRDLAQRLGVSDNTRFLGVRQDIPTLMAGADVFTLSSLSEGISVTLLEAMAAGLPIATTDVGGNSEIVVEGQTGLLSPRADPEGLGRNLISLLRDQDLRSRMGRDGRQRLHECFTQQRMHDAYQAIYERMLQGKRT